MPRQRRSRHARNRQPEPLLDDVCQQLRTVAATLTTVAYEAPPDEHFRSTIVAAKLRVAEAAEMLDQIGGRT